MPILPLIIATLISGGATSAAPIGTPPETLQRNVQTFDFEESKTLLLEMPLGFTRVTPIELNRFTSFGAMQPDNQQVRSGAYSFRFDVDGHSMAARSTPGLIPVRTGTEYEVAGWIHTEHLHSAHAGLAAWLIDAQGLPIPGTLVMSQMTTNEDGWTRVSIVVPGRDTTAHDLMLECRVLQPEDRVDATGSQDPDINGTAWFDDITVTQLPSVQISDGTSSGIHHLPVQPLLRLEIDDPAIEPIDWTLRIEDTDGNLINQSSGRMTDTHLNTTFEAELPRCGWYTAILETTTIGDKLVERSDSIDLILLPNRNETDALVPTIGINLTEPPTDTDLQMTAALGIGILGIPAMTDSGTGVLEDDVHRHRLGRFLDEGGTLCCRFSQIPDTWRRVHALDADQVVEFILLDEATWGPVVDRSLLPFGDAAAQWTITTNHETTSQSMIEAAANVLQERLVRLAPNAAVRIESIQDEGLELGVENITKSWRHNTPWFIAPPWLSEDDGRYQPTRDYPALHAILRHLAGRTFGGEFHIDRHCVGWFLEGHDTRSSGLMIVADPDCSSSIDIALGTGPMQLHDLMGNQQQIEWDGITHHVPINGRRTLFIEGVDPTMVRFHRDLAVDPPKVIARPRSHRHELVVTNPWNRPLEGVLHFDAAGRLLMNPPRISLQLPAGATQRIPVELVVEGPLPPGDGVIDAMVMIQQPTQMRFPVRCWLDIGLPDIELKITHERTETGFHVMLTATNASDAQRRIEAGITGIDIPSIPPQRFDIAPGASMSHRFDLSGLPEHIDGRTVHLQVGEVDATGRISHVMVIPDEPAAVLTEAHAPH